MNEHTSNDLSIAADVDRLIALIPDGHPDKPNVLDSLGTSYIIRFQNLAQLVDLNTAIKCESEVVRLSPENLYMQEILQNLGALYKIRFERLGRPLDLDAAIKYGREAVFITPSGHPSRPDALSNLAISYWTRFVRLGKLSDMNRALECREEVVSLISDGDPDKPIALGSLGFSYRSRFRRLGELADLDKAIEYETRAVALTPNGHSDKPKWLSTLGYSYQLRFERLGELQDLNKATEYETEALALAPNGHTDRSFVLDNLGCLFYVRFKRFGQPLDLGQSLSYEVEAVTLTPDGHPCMSQRIGNLGLFYLTRFRHLDELPDLDEAIKYQSKSVALVPDGHPEKSNLLNSLGSSYQTRFKRLGEMQDLNKALECRLLAVAITPDGHPYKSTHLANLGTLYSVRFEHLGELSDLKKSIECETEAVSLTPDGHADKPMRLSNIGMSYIDRFNRVGDLLDLRKAIESGEKAVSLTPDGHTDKPKWLNNLGTAYEARFQRLGETSDLDSAILCYKTAAQSFTGLPHTRLIACRKWAQLSPNQVPFSSYPAYQQAMELLPQFVWIGSTITRRYSLVATIGDFVAEAASYAISMDNISLALEWLEAGRSVVWAQIAQLRTPFDLLSTHDAALASRLKEVGEKLEHAGSNSSSDASITEDDRTTPEKEAVLHIELANEWSMLLSEARSIPGFEDFLRPPKSSTLLHAAKSHAIAVIHIHGSRCDALVLRPGTEEVAHIPLVNFSVGTALAAHKHLDSLTGYRGFVRIKKWIPEPLESVLKDLWLGVVLPVLDYLGYKHKLPVHQLPRITWCTTGMLSFLPLHAAGSYDQFRLNTFDFVVSSYTPTIGALLTSQSVITDAHGGILAVGQEHTPGFSSLPCVKDELRIIEKHSGSGRFLQLGNHEATVDRVLDMMGQFSGVHMACHGTQNPVDPTQSAFHLYDGNLTLATIAKQKLRNKGLAFLSACQTASGDENVPDEAVHLAAGLLMAGYPSVIGTMWSILDEDGPNVADRVYAELMKGGKMNNANAARALHQAVVHLRAEVGEKEILRWAPFIHMGA